MNWDIKIQFYIPCSLLLDMPKRESEKREGQTVGTPKYKYYFTRTAKGVRYYPKMLF